MVLVIGSALASWLSKRRQEKQVRRPPESDQPSPSPLKRPSEFSLEEILRQLMGEESLPREPRPPPLRRTSQRERTPMPEWPSEEPLQPAWTREDDAGEMGPTPRHPAEPAPPVLRQPSTLARVSGTVREASELEGQAARRFEQLNEQGRHPATVVSHTWQYASRSGPRVASRWRDSRSVRQAFIASIVLAPPKSLEP